MRVGITERRAVGKTSGGHDVSRRVRTEAADLFHKRTLRRNVLLYETVSCKGGHCNAGKEQTVVSVFVREACAVVIIVANLHAFEITCVLEEGRTKVGAGLVLVQTKVVDNLAARRPGRRAGGRIVNGRGRGCVVDGVAVGVAVGSSVGSEVGSPEGVSVGVVDGVAVGETVGDIDGINVGSASAKETWWANDSASW